MLKFSHLSSTYFRKKKKEVELLLLLSFRSSFFFSFCFFLCLYNKAFIIIWRLCWKHTTDKSRLLFHLDSFLPWKSRWNFFHLTILWLLPFWSCYVFCFFCFAFFNLLTVCLTSFNSSTVDACVLFFFRCFFF